MNEILHEYWHILTDPSHALVEFTFVLLDYLIIRAVGHQIIKHLHRDITAGRHKK